MPELPNLASGNGSSPVTGHDALELSASALDNQDPLARFREHFELPEGIYFVGNSLGALPRATRQNLQIELDRWATHGVEGHFTGELAWRDAHELVTGQLADLTGSRTDEVVAMNSLTVNLHLLMVSFYQPTPKRHKILIEDHAFPSDHFAVESQLRQRGLDPAESLVVVSPRAGEQTLNEEDLLSAIADHGDELALVLLPGVHYYTGQVLPMERLVGAAHQVGAKIGFDLAHAVGNIELDLHRWNVDFAVWCTYKYLNAGPGGVGGAFVHRRHVDDQTLPKLLGWWGTNKATRFEMLNEFDPIPTVESWQLSNAPVLSLAALRASLDIFSKAGGMGALRAKSERQLTFFDQRLRESLDGRVETFTPQEFSKRGCQYALRVIEHPGVMRGKEVFVELQRQGVKADWREPSVIRVAPVPLYNSFEDIDRFVSILDGILS